MTHQPPRTLRPELEQLLASRPPHIAETVRRLVTDVRPCVALKSTRASNRPARPGWLDRLRNRAGATPVLSAAASKFGGAPYCEQESELDGGRFLGQINFAEAARALHEQQFPIPAGMPEAGLLAVDLVDGSWGNYSLLGRTRWYPAPRISEFSPSAPQTPPANARGSWAVARYEAGISFIGSWSMQGLDWYDVVKGDQELWDYMNNLEIDGVDVDAHGGHKLFGHANEILNEHYGLTPAPGRSDAIRDYALVWRIDADRAAGFHWRTNWLYVVIHKDDLARGAFEHAIVTKANA